ncbi:MAG: aminotransferase class IV family protein [Bacteroidales bacterium]|nr:aminotransferase class IV family protein [Bacteroidales bacterium]
MYSGFICHNGKFLLSDENSLRHDNRAFCYGDALFETIHCLGTEPQFIDRHWRRLSYGMSVLKMNAGNDLTLEIIRNYIEKLLNKNRIFKGARLRLTVYRDQGGLYTPEKNSVSWMLEASALENEMYELNPKGLTIDIFNELYKPVNRLSNLKTNNALVYILAGLYRRDNSLDECIILNEYKRIAECISSNLFLVFEKEIITPPLSEGCISGIMREVIIEIASSSNFSIKECTILKKDLIEADEIFITNTIQGIRWIGAYGDRRYFNFVTRKLLAELNRKAFEN